MGGFYTTDPAYTFNVAQYPGSKTLTCAEALQALKDTDATNANATGFIAYGLIDGVNYEVRPFTYIGADAIYIRDNADNAPESDYNLVCFYIVNGINANARARQYFYPVTNGGVITYNSYRNSGYASYTFDSQVYNGTAKNSKAYAEPFIYISNLTDFGDVYFNGDPLVSYNWVSVPSVSGKNGILTLSTLNDVNDGEPVETSDISKFNLTDDSNVSALVAAHFSQ